METPEKKLSPAETVKANSRYLRGTIAESLAGDSTHFSKDDNILLKSHGSYEQDDRDLRQKLLAEKKEPAYSMMVRIKIPGGRLSGDQYLVYDRLADQYGNGTLRITTRQGFQFHGVLKKNLKTVVASINKALGTTSGACGDNVRNVLACPAPFKDRKKSRLIEYAEKVSNHFLPQSGAYQEIWLDGEKVQGLDSKKAEEVEPIYGKNFLPRKFKIAFAWPDDNCVDAYSNDLGIVPEISRSARNDGGEELTGFNILVGGGFGTTHGVATTYPRLATPLCFVKPEELVAICDAIVLTQRDYGNRADRKRARMKYLIDDRGLDWFRAEVEKRFGKKTEAPHEIHWTAIYNHLGWHEQGDGKWFLGLPIEAGRIKDAGTVRLKTALREAVKKFSPGLYLTCQQDFLLGDLEEGQRRPLEELLRSYGVRLPEEVSAVRKDSMACPAMPTCGLAITESERVLPGMMDRLEKKLTALGLDDRRIMVRMTGCPNGCARPYNAEIAFVGRSVGTYNVYVGGSLIGDRLNFVYAEKVLENNLVESVFPVLDLYKKEGKEGEGFGDFCHRLGLEELRLKIKKTEESH